MLTVLLFARYKHLGYRPEEVKTFFIHRHIFVVVGVYCDNRERGKGSDGRLQGRIPELR